MYHCLNDYNFSLKAFKTLFSLKRLLFCQFNELSHEQQHIKLTQFQSLTIDQLCKKRLENQMPLQYIIGEWDFKKINLKMKPPIFIPRPETEVNLKLSIKIKIFKLN